MMSTRVPQVAGSIYSWQPGQIAAGEARIVSFGFGHAAEHTV